MSITPGSPGVSPTSSQRHPHPLRSHRSSEAIDTTTAISQDDIVQRSDRPDSFILRPNNAYHHTHSRYRNFSWGGSSIHKHASPSADLMAPLPSLLLDQSVRPPSRTPERFGHSPVAAPRSPNHFDIVPARLPLKPTVSFGAVSYYSHASEHLHHKSLSVAAAEEASSSPQRRHFAGRSVIFSLIVFCLLSFVCGMSATSLVTALPTIAVDLKISTVDVFWVSVACLAPSTLLMPFLARFAEIFSPRLFLLFSLALLAGASTASALSSGFHGLLIGRILEGCGIAGVRPVLYMITTMLAPTKHLSTYELVLDLTYWLGIAIGPIQGGALVGSVGWRYIFWVNVPLVVVALLILPLLLFSSYEVDTYDPAWGMLKQFDYIGCFLSGSSFALLFGIAYTGSMESWSSWQVLLPLILGIITLAIFAAWIKYAASPTFTLTLRHLPVFVHGFITITLTYLLPIFFLAATSATPFIAGLSITPWTVSLPLAILIVSTLRHHLSEPWLLYLGWILTTGGTAFTVMLSPSTEIAACTPIGILTGIGLGMLVPVLKPSDHTESQTMHLLTFTLGQTFGVAVGSTIFINRFSTLRFLDSNASTYPTTDPFALLNLLRSSSNSTQTIRAIASIKPFTSSLQTAWIILAVLSALTLLGTVFFTSFSTTFARRRRRRRTRLSGEGFSEKEKRAMLSGMQNSTGVPGGGRSDEAMMSGGNG